MGRTIRLFTTQNLEQKMEPCSEEKCHLPRYIKLVLKWGDSDVGEGVEIFFHQPPSILVSHWSAPVRHHHCVRMRTQHVVTIKKPVCTAYVYCVRCSIAYMYCVRNRIAYMNCVRNRIAYIYCVRYSLLYFNFCDSMYYYMYMYLFLMYIVDLVGS